MLKNMGVAEDLPKGVKLLTAGTPLDLELLPVAQELLQAEVHDLYGCQEIGWLAMDGIPVRGRYRTDTGGHQGRTAIL